MAKTATGTIRDDDTAGIALSDRAIRISGIGGSADYAVRLESEPEAPVTIAVTMDTPGVAGVSPRRLVFTGSDWNRTKRVTITGAGIGGGQVVHEASSVDSNYAGLQARVRIRVDDDLVEVAAPWLARFARTSAGNVLDGITNRRTALRTPGFEGAVAGRSLDFAARTDDELSISGDRLPVPEYQPLSAGEVLPATAFALTSEQAEGGGSLALWGRGAWSRFEGIDDELTLEGGKNASQDTNTTAAARSASRRPYHGGLLAARSSAFAFARYRRFFACTRVSGGGRAVGEDVQDGSAWCQRPRPAHGGEQVAGEQRGSLAPAVRGHQFGAAPHHGRSGLGKHDRRR